MQLRRICGFVAQEDNLLPLLTVKETLMFSAKFKLRGMYSEERNIRVETLMQELDLLYVANSFIGDEETRGVSGGERKRVSIGVAVIHDPPILLLDEPTSGLDSTSAYQVIELLSSMAKVKQRTIVLTIHQPSFRILHYIDKFLFLSRGSVIHSGSLDQLEETITSMGFKIPIEINALEFAMEIIKPLEDMDPRSCSLVEHNKESPDYLDKAASLGKNYASGCRRFWIGKCVFKVEALPKYLQERRVLMKEASRGSYKVSSYKLANTMISIPFLLVVAILFAVPVYWLVGLNPSFTAFAFFLLFWEPSFFSGYFIPKENIPKYWMFMYYVSLYKYPLDSLLVNEYWSMQGKCFSWKDRDHLVCSLTGGDVLRVRGLED
ncbi:hypothetical protein GIB67_018867 [Kingdonia uniflora]|uniref:ABC transporter domain-containing protein n=1 Tax=Kingdonia uniflora TaxID=39325 RepID=A0A7J7MZ15_9MAGN|nr:hypothetical protein GIB67_018867 [Kingdonia uniflora]